MPVLILAGLPRSLADRVKATKEKSQSTHGLPTDWHLNFVNTSQKKPSLSEADVQRVCREASKSTESHVVGVSVIAGDSRKQVAQRIRPFFRFRWFDNNCLHMIYNSNPDIMKILSDVIREETYWGQHVKPKNHHHALLLPKGSFNDHRFQELWEACEAYGDMGLMKGAARKINLFTNKYLGHTKTSERYPERRCWKDSNSLLFDQNGPRHGKAPDWFQWKYSLRLLDGFHYDVSHESQQAFQVKDANGILHRVARGKHINLDPHGRVR